MAIFVCMIIVAIVYLMADIQMNILEICTNLFRTFVEQGVSSFCRWIEESSISLDILIFFWLITSSCITRSFKSILLNTYYETKPSLTVNTLEDIINLPDLSISGSYNLDSIEHFKPELYNDLMKRTISYEKRMGIDYTIEEGILASYSRNIIEEVVNRKGVIITNTYTTDMFKKMYPMYKLMESDVKYAQLFVYIVVHKNIPHYSQIYKL